MSFDATIAALRALDTATLTPLYELLDTTRAAGGTIWIAGNGGSMSTAQHWACDLSKAAGLRAQALGSNPAVLTAWANDTVYGQAFACELARMARPGDCLICLSCSGTSPNIVEALTQAAHMRIPSAIVTSAAWENPLIVPVIAINVASADYGVIEDCHLAIGHWLTRELRQ